MFQRLFGWFRKSTPTPASPAAARPSPRSKPGVVAVDPPAHPAAAASPASRLEGAAAAIAAVGAESPAEAEAHAVAPSPKAMLEEELLLTLRERCRVLLQAAPPETSGSDAPAVIDSLMRLGETVIRQPPLAAQRVLAAVRDSNRPTRDFVPLFESDPALTRGLLRMANSAFYRRGSEPCISISESVQLIGLRGVECVVTQSMVEGMLCRPGGNYMGIVTEAWAHMTRTAPLARRLSWRGTSL